MLVMGQLIKGGTTEGPSLLATGSINTHRKITWAPKVRAESRPQIPFGGWGNHPPIPPRLPLLLAPPPLDRAAGCHKHLALAHLDQCGRGAAKPGYTHMAMVQQLPNGTLVMAWQAARTREGDSDQHIVLAFSLDPQGTRWDLGFRV